MAKTTYFYMRLSVEQKELLMDLSSEKQMTMTEYIWHLIAKDRESYYGKK